MERGAKRDRPDRDPGLVPDLTILRAVTFSCTAVQALEMSSADSALEGVRLPVSTIETHSNARAASAGSSLPNRLARTLSKAPVGAPSVETDADFRVVGEAHRHKPFTLIGHRQVSGHGRVVHEL